MSAIWKGHLRIKQVTIPIALQAVESSRQSSAQLQPHSLPHQDQAASVLPRMQS